MSDPAPIDKSSWGPGPWQDETDRVEWREHGFPCLITRNGFGALCGYVAVTEGHPWFGKDYGDIDAEAHGGLTYAAACQGDKCHVPGPGEPDNVWWVGFDCGHVNTDVLPGYRSTLVLIGIPHPVFFPNATYKTIDYVRNEVNALAEQARAVLESK